MRNLVKLSVAALGLASSVGALPKITRAGRYLYDESGSRFYIKGIAYQEQGEVVADPDNPFGEPSSFVDPLAKPDDCARDVPFLQQLGVNTIRVYSVDSSLNHDACMNALDAAGIYTIIDLSLPVNGSIDRLAPSWSANLLNLYIQSIDAFSKYNNVLAYNIGNEVVINSEGSAAAAYVKAAARDTKAYLASKSSSALVGYAAIDGGALRNAMANYLSCDASGTGDGSTAIDLYGLNNYAWCGQSTFETAYSGTTTAFANYNVPAYFSEFGCIRESPRVWTEAPVIFGPQMSNVWSGGLAFSYFPAQSAAGQFGMVTISPDGKTVTTSPDFDNLRTQFGQLTPPTTPDRTTAGATTYPACAAPDTTFLANSKLPPTPNDGACKCLEQNLSCQFTPQTPNSSVIVGSLLDTGCSLLGQSGGSCAEIGGDGATGVYGRVSGCSPPVKLSFIMSEYYEANSRNPQACSFAGNGTVNANAPTSVSAANAAASSCLSNPAAVFTPTAPAGGPAGGTSKPTSTGKGGSGNGAASLVENSSLFAVSVIAVVSVGSGLLTLI